jgi:hypothetical protein
LPDHEPAAELLGDRSRERGAWAMASERHERGQPLATARGLRKTSMIG